MTKLVQFLWNIHRDQRGHKNPILWGMVMILGMVVAGAMVGIFYLAGMGFFSGQNTDGINGLMAPENWPQYDRDQLKFRHPPTTHVTSKSSGHVNQIQSELEMFDVNHETTLRIVHEPSDDLIGRITLGRYQGDESRESYYQYRRSLREDDEETFIQRVTVNQIPGLLFDRRSQSVNRPDRETRSLTIIMLTNSKRYVEASSATFSGGNKQSRSNIFLRIVSSLEVQDPND